MSPPEARTEVTAFAPVTVGNACVGFDVLGFALPVAGDTATVSLLESRGPGRVTSVTIHGADELPTDPTKNTASVALAALLDHVGALGSFHVHLRKGIPASAGMGGSAASAVAAVVAGNALLGGRLARLDLLPYALIGEAVASGGFHADNVAPALLGGLTATAPGPTPKVIHLPVPGDIRCVLVHPHLKIDTRDARDALSPQVSMAAFVSQSAHLVFFVEALRSGDHDRIRESMQDVVVEPQRAHLVPGFQDAKKGALAAGAIGCSISGAGPSVFAWAGASRVHEVRDALVAGLSSTGVPVDAWIGTPGGEGAHVVPAHEV